MRVAPCAARAFPRGAQVLRGCNTMGGCVSFNYMLTPSPMHRTSLRRLESWALGEGRTARKPSLVHTRTCARTPHIDTIKRAHLDLSHRL